MAASDNLHRELFDRYIDERRASPIPGFRVEVLPHFTRYISEDAGADGLVMYARIPDAEALPQIAEQARFFAARQQPLEWKIYDFDRPANLRALLEAEGFAAHHDEVFLVRDLDEEEKREIAAPPGVEIRSAKDDPDVIDDIVRVQEGTWDAAFAGLAAQLRSALAAGPLASTIYCAYLDGAPVGSGWIDFTQGSHFADLHGGAVLEKARGRGIYTLLYRRRAEDARARGCRYLAVDAAPMSRPILQGKGFIPVCGTYPMRSAPHATREQ